MRARLDCPRLAGCQPAEFWCRPEPISSRPSVTRAVRVGPHIAVAGTTGPGATSDVGTQTREALRRIGIALREAGASLDDVIRTRIYVTDISRWREVAAAHAEVFGQIRPAATMVEVAALIAPELLVEIEADAYSANGGKVPSAAGQ